METAISMFTALLVVGILAAVLGGGLMPLVIAGLVIYAIWSVADGLGG